MNRIDSTPRARPADAGARDRALRLRKRFTAGIAGGAIAAVAGFGVLAEQNFAGTVSGGS
jgi:hypothetical protein